MDFASLATEYQETFDAAPERVFFSPGRINLIGEYTDFNGGHVFPAAISLGTFGAFTKRDDRTVRMYSANLPKAGVITWSLDDLKYDKAASWTNYFKGMLFELAKQGKSIDHGFDLFVHGNLPDGSGLSSSASVEMLMGEILLKAYDMDISRVELVKVGQQVENDYLGLNTGIMDQFAVGMGKKDQAILLDTNTLKYEYAPVKMGDYVVVIMNTKKRRELTDSKYNERRAQCEEALRRLQTKLDIKTLGDLNGDEFDENSYLVNDDILIKRARHAVVENQRTLRAYKALQANDLETFGKLVNASHISLHYDFAVTGKELDTLVEAAWAQPGVLGARMTGAGFGGCAIAIVKEANVDTFEQTVGKVYEDAIGHPAEFYIAHLDDGPRELTK
ncbi:MAG TPA: galactokinase [Candidatus Levilactobacillus faecigallinarum]|uniref:Galactokinase n=1 Tax=Candidatus Levilactobacillus faecigallinarum TaxID=2838638 RepID=A0A9D1QRD5_9LACO|nr:galactokinase [Candidatus Levilactobacillus faecigallinarum]